MSNGRILQPTWWAASVAAFLVATLVIALMNGADSARLPYLWLMFALCTFPFAIAESLNGRHAILVLFMPLYFIYFALGDLLALFGKSATAEEGVGMAEIAIVLGGVMLTLGYCVAAGRRKIPQKLMDWSPAIALWTGLIFWLSGVAATLYWQIILQKGSFQLGYVSPTIGMVVTLGRMLQPLGMAILAYRLVTRRSWLMFGFVGILICVEFVVGFISDSKELAIRGMVVTLVATLLLRGKIPKMPLVVAGMILILAFPIFQAYRLQVLGIRGEAREQAARNLMENLSLAIDSLRKPSIYGSEEGPGFIGRVSLKGNIIMTLQRVGNTAPFQHGYTYMLFLDGMVPRVFWQDKPDTSVGQLFNRELKISEFKDVYISPSFLGEAYWNFGWAGIVGCMFALGALLGFVAKRFSLTEGISVTRFLVIVTTLYGFGLRFEGGIALEALIWIRGLAALGLLHWLLARKQNSEPLVSAASSDLPALVPPRWPNLMQ